MHDLPRFMPVADDGVIDPTPMQNALSLAAAAVSDWLRPYIGLRLNASSSAGLDFAHGELQVVSMIARAAAGRWDTRGDWSQLPDWKADWDQLRVAVPQHYLLDLLQEVWRGPIYSTVFNRVWQTDDEGHILGPASFYADRVSRRAFCDALDAWFERQLDREQRSRPYVRSIDRTFLRFVYSDLVTHKLDTSTQFELEHLYPVSRLKNIISASGGPGWPISSIANLALFTKSLNREKSSATISEYLAMNKLTSSEQETLERLLLCEASDVAIDDGSLTLEEYIAFLRRRWTTMRDAVAKNLSIDA